jgi:hypothetical protein
MCEENGPGNKIVEITDKLEPVDKIEDMVVKNYSIARLQSWDFRIVEGASLPYICLVIEFCQI